MASADDNQDGILGNLPRSRPGVRSDKRDPGTTGAKKAPAKAQAAAAKPKQPAAPRPAQRTAPPPKPPPTPPPREPARSSDPIEQAVHLAGEVAEAGIRTVAKVARGVLRRLPRP